MGVCPGPVHGVAGINLDVVLTETQNLSLNLLFCLNCSNISFSFQSHALSTPPQSHIIYKQVAKDEKVLHFWAEYEGRIYHIIWVILIP